MEALATATVVHGVATASLKLYSGIITAIAGLSALSVGYAEGRSGGPQTVGIRLARLAVAYACIVSLAASPTDYLFEVVAGFYILVGPRPRCAVRLG